jgi:hypothetical protein
LSGKEFSTIERTRLTSDLEILATFFENSARRNRQLKERFGLGASLIPQELLNDLLIQRRGEAD